MAFHVACPITCRRICFCALGFARGLQAEKGKNEFLQEVAKLEDFLNDPWLIKARENATIQVKVPKVEVVSPAPPPPPVADSAVAVGSEEVAAAASAQVKRVALQKQAAAASVVAEDYARRFESGDLVAPLQETAGEELGLSNVKVMCRMCFSGENEGSERARKMLSCNSCGKKYHRSCLKSWSQNRDLFHWSSWTCPSCRTCEVCRRTGDPNKFMFCKRCDGAYHCYCQQPPHKNVGHGPYLCPKHTKCHSCGSSVPGNGLSVRWFLGNTCCDACGRLFVKGNYCPVCLKVYRDSEATPMVCCDICEHWVHCPCDGISDAKYMQFQSDGNLQYVCPTCRGECYKIKNLEEAVQELWRRRDEADKDLIASLRAAAGLPTQEEIFDISPFSDDEESGPLVKNEFSRSLKFSVKGLGDKSPMKGKEHGKRSSSKKHVKKKGNELSLISRNNIDGPLLGYNSSSDYKKDEMQFSGEPVTHSPVAGSLNEGMYSVKEAADPRNKNIDDVSATSGTKKSRTIKIKSSKAHSLTSKEESGTNTGLKTAQGSKLVIHLGGRNRNANSPPRSEASSLQKGQDMTPSDVGTEDTSQLKHHELDRLEPETKFRDQKGYKTDHTDQVKTSKIKFKNVSSEVSNSSSKPTGRYSSTKYTEDGPTVSGDMIDDSNSVPSKLQASSKDGKTNLKFKIPKNSNSGNQNIPSKSNNNGNQITLPLPGKEEITYTRGQRSKRRRPASGEGDTSQWGEDNTVKDFTDANWILQKLGKDAAGKRVEVHQSSNNTWHRGTVIEVFEGTSIVSIALDDGKTNNYELGKQGIRFVSQKQKS